MRRNLLIFQGLILLGLCACGGMGVVVDEYDGTPYYESPPSGILFSDKELFNQALSLQYKGQLKSAIGLWEKFLVDYPSSFEALNNLGMAYYSNDQLDKSISSFDSARTLEPKSPRIKKNLTRTLRFRVTLYRENQDDQSAISDLQKIASMSNPKKKERILREVEDLQERIFSEVEKINTVEEYQRFLERYAEGFYAEKVREKIRELEPKAEGAAPPKPKEFLPPINPKQKPEEPALTTMQSPETSTMELPGSGKVGVGPLSVPTLPVLEENMQPKGQEMKEVPAEVALMESASVERKKNERQTSNADVLRKILSQPAEPAKKVKVVTKVSVLNIRAQPSLKSKVIGKLKNGAEVRMIDQEAEWYRVVYATGKNGWISKRYAKEIK